MIATLTNSTGVILGNNEVSCTATRSLGEGSPVTFSTLIACWRAWNKTLAVMRTQLPDPSATVSGLDPANTQFQIWTRFYSPPTVESIATNEANGMEDATVIGFSDMSIGVGNGFLAQVDGATISAGPVVKQWVTLPSGETYLVESILYSTISPLLAQLPEHASLTQPLKTISRTAALEQQAAPHAKSFSGPMKVALNDARTGAKLVTDYNMAGTYTNCTFQGDTTYYISGLVNLAKTTTWEGGAIIKFTNNVEIEASVSPVWNFPTNMYRPIIFTGKDDDSIGSQIYNSTGNPTTNC